MNKSSGKLGEKNDATKNVPQTGFEEAKAILPSKGQTYHSCQYGDSSSRAGILAAVELGGGTSFHISVFDILAGPWRHTADGIPISYRHVRGRPRSQTPP